MNNMYPKTFRDLIKPINKEIRVTILLSFLGTLSLLIAPLAVTKAVQKYFRNEIDVFLIWVVIAGLGLILRQVLHTFSLGYAHKVEAKFRYKLRKDFSDKLSKLPLGFFNETPSGAIRKLISEDSIKIHTIIAHSFSDFTAGVTLPIGCSILMIIFEWKTALMILGSTLLFLVIGVVIMMVGNKSANNINEKYEKAQREMSHSVVEMVDGIKEIKNFGMTSSVFKRFDKFLNIYSTISFEWLNTSSKAISFIMAIIQPTIMLFLSILICIFSIKNGWMATEYAILFILLSISLPSSLIDLMQLGNHIRDGKHSVNTLLALYSKVDQKYNEKPSDFIIGDIKFNDVSFSYDNKNKVLDNINCKMEKGKLTALVGSSGSGKTTMARLIARFWDVTEGEITIGGVNIKDLSEQDLLANVSLVFQDISLMNASIADNISLSKQCASREEIINAAKSACIHERITKLPNGYDSIYGEADVILSGGEKQRITIARAFLANTPIILLDEATAQADAESEVEIQKALCKLSKDKTVIIIAHRLSSIVNADEILVMEGGEIIQRGSHEDLSSLSGMYRDMWLAQTDKKGDE